MDQPPPASSLDRTLRRGLRRMVAVLTLLVAAGIVTAHASARREVPEFEPIPDAYESARLYFQHGNVQCGIEALLRVSRDDRHYSRAMRRLGFNVLTSELKRPREGVMFVERALAADPTDLDNWVDLMRTYLATLESLVREA